MDTKKSFEFLTKHIKEDPDFDEKNFDLIALLPSSEAKQTHFKKCHLHNVDGFGELCDVLTERIIYSPVEKELMKFFRKVHNNEFVYKIKNDANPLKVVDVFYKYYFYNELYVVAEPQRIFYKWDKAKDININIKIADKHIEKQLEKLLSFLNIDFSDYKEDYGCLWIEEINDFEYKFQDLAVTSWKTIKKETNSKLLGFMAEGTGIHDTINLDTNESANYEEDIIDYVKKKGLDIQRIKGEL